MNLKDKSQIIGYLLFILMLFAILNSAYFFLSIANFKIADWIIFNSCSLAIFIYLLAFIFFQLTKNYSILAVALLPLYYYGTMGLFVTPWNNANIFPQITHAIITLNIVWVLYIFLKELRYESLGKGLLIGFLVFVPIFALLRHYLELNIEEYVKMIQ
jgi:hypothetical protein